jgi:hypothetical protein
MPGFPLAALGAGLGQWANSARQQQEARVRNQYMQMALQQQQRERMAKELEGLALASGGLPGFGNQGGGGISPVGQGVGVPIQPPPAAPPMPQPPAAAATPGPAAADIATNPFYKGGVYQGEGAPATGQQSIPLDSTPAAPAAAPTAPAPAPASQAAPQGQAAPDAGFAPVGETKDGRVIFDVPNMGKMDLTSMFRQVDPSAIAQKIKQLRPDAPSDAIAMATESLYKMANTGGKAEQLQVATLLRYLNATRSQDIREKAIDTTAATAAANRGSREGIAGANRDVTRRGQDLRDASGAANREQRAQQFGQRQTDLRAKQALDRATGQTKMQLGTLERQMADIVRRQNVIINGPNPSSAQNKSAFEQMNKSLDALEKQRDEIAATVLGTAQ